MKADRSSLAANLARLDPDLRLILFYGPDEAASHDYLRQIARQFESAANPMAHTVIPGAALKDDPARLAAAAAEISMFGDRTLVIVEDAGDDAADAVAALLAMPAGNPVVMTAGALKKGSKLVAHAETARTALAQQNYAPEARDADAIVGAYAAEYGVKPARGVARALFEATGGDRGVLRSEIEKLALYLDASPAAPRPLDLADVAAVGAALGDAELNALIDAVASGRPDIADVQMTRLATANIPGITQLRGLARRFALLLELRALVDGGASPQAVVDGARPPVFWKEKPTVAAQLSKWRTPAIRAVLHRLLETERAIKRSGSAGEVLATQAMLGVATMAAARG
jgi:DNA polymerase III subunit delta